MTAESSKVNGLSSNYTVLVSINGQTVRSTRESISLTKKRVSVFIVSQTHATIGAGGAKASSMALELSRMETMPLGAVFGKRASVSAGLRKLSRKRSPLDILTSKNFLRSNATRSGRLPIH
jgi:hypothetical protein